MDDENPEKRANLLPYPTSTLAPQIVPNDLTSFKSRGVSRVEKSLRQRLLELKEEYERIVTEFNWNKLIYEAKFNFEPLIGQTYHLYETEPSGSYMLTMIGPDEWSLRFIGSFRLDADQTWKALNISEDFDLREVAGESPM